MVNCQESILVTLIYEVIKILFNEVNNSKNLDAIYNRNLGNLWHQGYKAKIPSKHNKQTNAQKKNESFENLKGNCFKNTHFASLFNK